MNQSQDYGFCPNCGAVSKNGVCTSCGYRKKPGRQGGFSGKEYMGFALASLSLIAVFTAVFFIYHSLRFKDGNSSKKDPMEAARGSYNTAISETKVSVPEINTWDDEFFDVFSLRVYNNMDTFLVPEESSVPEASDYDYYDDYDYYVYDDYIRTDLDYKIVNNVWKYSGYAADTYGDGYPEDAFIRCDFPVIESDSLGFTDKINDIIADTTTYMCDYYEACSDYIGEDRVFYGEESVYVTYMNEDVLSLLFSFDGYLYDSEFEEEEPELLFYTVKAVNFDMKTGKVLEMPEVSVSKDDFAERFIEGIIYQYNINVLETVSKEDLLSAYENGAFQWFYNPLGVEIIYCFPDLYGYLSCTENPDDIFSK